MTKHGFNEGTKLERVRQILSDLQWHCGKHELPGTQPAKAIQTIRHHGFDVEKKTIYCAVCKDKTVHRRLTSLKPERESVVRMPIPTKLRNRILRLYGKTEAITARAMVAGQLEVDHRFPQTRWSKDESFDPEMSDDEIRARFQLLTRAHNLWKSRYCERCAQTDERGTFIGINFFYRGGAKWDSSIPAADERGCVGCFWYNPDEWRKALNRKLAR